MGKDRFKKFMARDNSRRYWAQNKLDVSDIPGAEVGTIKKYKWHLKGADNNLNVEDIVPKQSILQKNIHRRLVQPSTEKDTIKKLSSSRRHV